MTGFLGILRKVFPFIAAAASVGGPLGTLAANAVGAALGTGTVPDATPDAIASVIAGATPEQMIALKQAEENVKVQLAQLGFQNTDELERIAEQDRESARARQIAVKDKTPTLLAWAITVGFFGILVMVARWGVAPSVHDLVVSLIGALALAWGAVVTYYFGSSAGSARKTEIMASNGSIK